MADSKKYDGSQWEHSLRKLTTATEAVENPLYSDGTAITAYTLKGNTTQSGTPTPSNPVEVNGVGNKTANLFNINGETDAKTTSVTIINNGIKFENVPSGNTARITYSAQYAAGTYNISCVASGSNYTVRLFSDSSFTGATYNSYYGGYYRDLTKSGFSTSLTFDNDFKIGFISNAAGGATFTIYDIMLSTAEADFEPYGYKIPISSGQQTIDIYIGDLPLLKSLDGTAVDEISNGTLTRRVDADGSVLPTPTTTQITMPSISTTDGANSITVDTTVQPSEFTATWTGWHDSSVKEWDGSDWR